jgi:pimeloyl-ACP methyl ester carboxylesterase
MFVNSWLMPSWLMPLNLSMLVFRVLSWTMVALMFILVSAIPVRAQLTLKPCGLAGERARCGTLRVAENPLAPEARQLSLKLWVIPRTGTGPSREPLFILKGGPGEAAAVDAEDVIEMFGRVRAKHDLVLLDQRGTGGSNRLDCDVADRTFFIPKDEGCLRRLAERADLRMYTTAHFIQDLETARSALGYERIKPVRRLVRNTCGLPLCQTSSG